VFNVGGAEPIAHRSLVELLIATAGSGRYRLVVWPAEKKAIDIGDFHADSSRVAAAVGWRARTPLAIGLATTLAFYREHMEHYVPTASQVGT
jgi:UDP-glucose 4-epimerase